MTHIAISTTAAIDTWGIMRTAASIINQHRGCRISAMLLSDLLGDATNFAAIEEDSFFWIIGEHDTSTIKSKEIEEWYEVINRCDEWIVLEVSICKARMTCLISEIMIEA